jgi:hypothetical protein
MIIVVDGPEKAGKSTLIAGVSTALGVLGYDVIVRKWGPLKTDDREYSPALKDDTEDHRHVVIWDRSWVSEHVYANLLERPRRLAKNSFLGEFLHRRALFGQGFGVILAPIASEMAEKYRDSTDLDVDPVQERTMFMKYSLQYKWMGLFNDYTEESLKKNVNKIVMKATKNSQSRHNQQQITVTPCIGSEIVFMGNQLGDPQFAGGWLPFTSERLIKFAEMFGESALAASWANSDSIDARTINAHRFIVTVGKYAEEKLKEFKTPSDRNIIRVIIPVTGGKYSNVTITKALYELSQQLSGIKRYLMEIWNASKSSI